MHSAERRVTAVGGALARAATLVFTGVLGACAGTPFQYRPPTEIPEGPGLLTGERGAFVLRGAEPAPAASSAAPAAAPGPNTDFDEFDAYRNFRRAKSERSLEYREFLEWLEWKRYREWKSERERKAQ